LLEGFDKEQGMGRYELGNHGEQQMVVDSMGGTTNFHDLAVRL